MGLWKSKIHLQFIEEHKLTVQHFRSKKALIDALDLDTQGKIDVNQSMFLPLFGFVTKEGKQYHLPNAPAFVYQYNKCFGERVSVQHTRLAGSRSSFLVNFLNDDKSVEVLEFVETSTEEVIPEELSQEVVVEAPVETTESVSFDKEHALTLKDKVSKKEAKEALEAYGRTLNVELNKSKTFENMLKDLEKALA